MTLFPSKVLSPTSEKCSSYLRTTTSTSKLCAWAEVGFSTLAHVVHGHGGGHGHDGGDVHGGGEMLFLFSPHFSGNRHLPG